MFRVTTAMTAACFAGSASSLAMSAAYAQDTIVNLETVVVSAEDDESATGPVEGYIAKASQTGTKTDTPLSKIPQSVTVVPADQIADQGAETLAETFRYSAGIYSEYRGDSTVTDEVFIRGFEFVPIYVNGLDYGTNRLGSIDPYLLERVEILRGPSSVLYGQATPGGLVNLVTKKPTGETKREVELGGGIDNAIGLGVDFQGTFDENKVWSYRFVGKAERSDTEIADYIEQSVSIAPSLRWQPTEDTSLTLLSIYNHQPDAGYRNFRPAEGTLYSAQAGWIPEDFDFSHPDVEQSIVTQFQLGYEFEHRFNEVFQVRQNAAYNIIDTSFSSVLHRRITGNTLFDGGNPATGTASRRDTDIHQFVIDNQLQSDFQTGSLGHTLLTGLDYKFTSENYIWSIDANAPNIPDWTNPTYPAYTPNWTVRSNYVTDASQIGLYAQDQIEFGNLNISLGGRYDWAQAEIDNETGTDFSYFDSAFSGRAGAIYNFNNGISPYVSYSTSFEPSLELDHNNEPLEPTTAQQVEAGVKYATADGNIQVIASLYQIHQQNVQSSPDGGTTILQTGEIRSRGFEVEARAQLTENLALIGALGYVDAEITKDEDPANVGLVPDMVPDVTASLWGKYEFLDGRLDGLGLGLGVRYIGESLDTTNTLTVKSATLLDAMASYDFGAVSNRFDGVSLQVNGTNILDRRYVSACASSAACWNGQGRTVTAKLKYTW
ncbi:TonB-dependent siderophore receptor [Roseibium aggregatum]|uniref:TonB-dependent siderophore receptor n=1 Tax=Roseibium aggregatum TaxID=187304 RepID=A0A939EJ50_9HYPH|nr:TonB-dependent siderophore receptor [Roseibium aggregatum]MBN9673253.1 TonB-dependent siderophore receptor [Roseibium aggregatum]